MKCMAKNFYETPDGEFRCKLDLVDEMSKEIMDDVGKRLKKRKSIKMKNTIICIEPNILKITKRKVKEEKGFFDPHMESYLIEYESKKAINYFIRMLKAGIKEKEEMLEELYKE